MPATPPDAPDADDHPPLPSQRIGQGEYDHAFLASLRANGQVRAVGADWNAGTAQPLPPHVTHVLYPNGDLERVGMS